MIKRLTEHTIYEIWNELAADSCLVDHKPTKKELVEISKKEGWLDLPYRSEFYNDVNQFVKDYISVTKVKRIYTNLNWIEPASLKVERRYAKRDRNSSGIY